MKLKRLIIFVSILVIISSIALPFTASAETTTVTYSSNIVYSDTSNSGTRHVVCTSTEGTGISDYYTGDNSIYEFASLKGDTLMKALRTFMTQTHKKTSSYADCKNLATKTDCENGDGRIVTIYTSHSATFNDFQGGTGWNREHVWPKSLGGFETSGGGADLHHIRPSESKTNSDRSNQKYGYVSSGKDSIGNLSGLIGGKDDNHYYEPNDNVKGDVARICLYVYVRWGGTYAKSNNLTNVFESIDVLLEWCALDPVDTWEMGRNEVVEAIQGNRNVFIDYPELAWLMFNEEIPQNMVTPSGWAMNGLAPDVCTHSETVVKNQKAASCTQEGYTGDIHCALCDTLILAGESISKLSHSYDNGVITKQPSHVVEGVMTYTCTCGHTVTEKIEKTNDHGFNDWIPANDGINHIGSCACGQTKTEKHTFDNGAVTKEPTHLEEGIRTYSCTVCKYEKTESIEKLPDHVFSAWTPDGTTHIRSCECGETERADHQFDNGKVTKEATHVELGIKTYTCTDCGATRTEDIDKITEHTFGNWVPDNDGINHYKSCECGETQKSEHKFDNGAVTKEPTHLEKGVTTYTCTDCGFTRTEDIEKIAEHTFSDWVPDDDGKNHFKLCECGETQKVEHSFDNGTVTREATHVEVGIKTYVCADCGFERNEDIAKLPEHTFGSWTYDDATNHSKRCECGEAQKSEHKYGEGTVTKEPTESEKGQKVYICEECKHVKTEAIDYEVNNDSENTSSCQNPSSSIGLFLCFLCIIPFIKKIKIFM